MLIWYEHYIFFLRYGMRNGAIIALNTVFIVIILFYVYPLKFLTTYIILIPISYIVGDEKLRTEIQSMMALQDVGQLMIIYGVGAMLVFLVLCLMYRYALKQADALELSELERYDTRVSIRSNLLMASVPMMSVVLAVFLRNSLWAGSVAGFAYFLYTPMMFRYRYVADRKRKLLLEEISRKTV